MWCAVTLSSTNQPNHVTWMLSSLLLLLKKKYESLYEPRKRYCFSSALRERDSRRNTDKCVSSILIHHWVGGIGMKILDAYETSFGPQQIRGKIHCPRWQCISSALHPFSLLLWQYCVVCIKMWICGPCCKGLSWHAGGGPHSAWLQHILWCYYHVGPGHSK